MPNKKTPQDKRKISARQLSKKLREASVAMYDYMEKCRDCSDGTAVTKTDDSRLRIVQEMTDYRSWLELRYGVDPC